MIDFLIESLELRRLFASAFPDAKDQYLIALINRARANPTAEAARYNIDLNEDLPPARSVQPAQAATGV